MRVGCCVSLAMAVAVAQPWLAVAPGFAASREADRVWVHPGLAGFGTRRIAVLPAVAIEGGPDVQPIVEKRWLAGIGGTGHRWLPPVVTRDRLRRAGGDSLVAGLADEVLRRGRVDSTTAPRVAQALGTHGLLSLRVDTWRREPAPVRGHVRAAVALTVALVDSSGALLWRIAGQARRDTTSVPQYADEIDQAPAEFEAALGELIARWRPLVPPASVPATTPRAP